MKCPYCGQELIRKKDFSDFYDLLECRNKECEPPKKQYPLWPNARFERLVLKGEDPI
jgi:hypothetical protein